MISNASANFTARLNLYLRILTSEVTLRDLDLFLFRLVTRSCLSFLTILFVEFFFSFLFAFTITWLVDLNEHFSGLSHEVGVVCIDDLVVLRSETWHLFEIKVSAERPVEGLDREFEHVAIPDGDCDVVVVLQAVNFSPELQLFAFVLRLQGVQSHLNLHSKQPFSPSDIMLASELTSVVVYDLPLVEIERNAIMLEVLDFFA